MHHLMQKELANIFLPLGLPGIFEVSAVDSILNAGNLFLQGIQAENDWA
jgi:hypothetical protein